MKVGFVVSGLGFGGAERVTCNLTKWFSKNGDTVSLYLTKPRQEKEYQLPETTLLFECYSSKNIEIISNLKAAFKKDRPSCVIVMGTPMCVHAVPALSGLGIPFIVSERSAPNNALMSRKTRLLSHFLIQFADACIFQTNGAKACFSRKVQKKGYVIPNPLIVEELPEAYYGKRKNVLVAVGRYVPEKNYSMLIAAFKIVLKKHPGFQLIIYGDGKQKDELIAVIDGEKRIMLHPSIPSVVDEIKDAYGYILSSNLEGMPNSLMEAMAVGLPCVSTDCPSGGPFELINNNVNGLLVKVNDTLEMAQAITSLIENPEFANQIGKEAVKLREKLDISIIGEQWKHVIQTVLH